jgi:hypothetical protein
MPGVFFAGRHRICEVLAIASPTSGQARPSCRGLRTGRLAIVRVRGIPAQPYPDVRVQASGVDG